MRCRFTGSWFKPHRRYSFAGDDVPQIFVFLGAIAIFGKKKKIFPNFLPDTLGGGVSQPDPPPPPPLQTPPTPPSPPSNTCLGGGQASSRDSHELFLMLFLNWGAESRCILTHVVSHWPVCPVFCRTGMDCCCLPQV